MDRSSSYSEASHTMTANFTFLVTAANFTFLMELNKEDHVLREEQAEKTRVEGGAQEGGGGSKRRR
jgi:hypothetical protein